MTCFTCSMNWGVGTPRGRRVHWKRMNSSGTREPDSGVSSITTGTMNAKPEAMSCVRSTPNFHSRRK